MFCKNCGRVVNEAVSVCPNCQAPIEGRAAAEHTPPAADTFAPPAAYTPPGATTYTPPGTTTYTPPAAAAYTPPGAAAAAYTPSAAAAYTPPGAAASPQRQPASANRFLMPVVIIAAVVIVAIGVTLGIVLNLPKDASPQPAATDAAYAPGASSNDGGNSGSGSSQGASSADDGVTGMGTGPIETIEVPNVVGMTEAEAIRAIENAGLKVGDVKSMASESVAKGKVISQTPEAPSWLAAGAVNTFKVSITVSEGSKQSDDFIFEDSDQRYLADQEIRALSDWERYIARNEIYARHGRGFLNQDLRDYFAGKDWYQERYSPQEFDAMGSGVLNDYERKNAERIRGIEEGFNSPYLK